MRFRRVRWMIHHAISICATKIRLFIIFALPQNATTDAARRTLATIAVCNFDQYLTLYLAQKMESKR